MKFKVSVIAKYLNGKVEGDANIEVNNISDIENAQSGDLTFLSNKKYESFIYETKASVVVIDEGFELKNEISPTVIRVKNAYMGFTQVLELVEQTKTKEKSGIEQPSFVHETATIGDNVYIGAFAYVGEGTIIGDNVKIYPNCYVGDRVEIKKNSLLHAGAKINHEVQIGEYCTIHPGAVVGSDGFGFAPQPDGSYYRIPQLGNVILEDFVSIGANTTVDRATFNSTILKKGVKLDNLIQIGHNCTIGENTVMAAQVGLAGTTEVGAQCMFGGQVGVSGHIKIANGSIIGPKAGVMTTVTEEGKSYLGAPMVDTKEFFRMTASMRKLPDLIKKVRDLEKKIED